MDSSSHIRSCKRTPSSSKCDVRLDVKVKDLRARRVFSPDTSYLTMLMVDLVMMMMMVTLAMDIVESDSEVKVVFDETANLRISTSDKDRSDKVCGTNSLLKQWRDSYLDNDDYDPFDDDINGGESGGGDVIKVDGGGGGVGLICDDYIS
uniref:Transmembrane protein n=1 Tax=Tanacetum cinerariifolium TaxID=118510 RepID=A0A6L2LZY1_TANCI|nr:hypothetical protein [Tanacetum cinerariifolium]